jgi:hypothetical protein
MNFKKIKFLEFTSVTKQYKTISYQIKKHFVFTDNKRWQQKHLLVHFFLLGLIKMMGALLVVQREDLLSTIVIL